MEFIQTKLAGVVLIKPRVFADERGFFYESYNKSLFVANGIVDEFIQDNHSKSNKGVLRGLHYQLNPHAQGKLVRCISGAVFDVAVDIRRGSPTFAQWVGYELSAANKYMLWLPSGFAHGFVTLQDNSEFVYKTTAEYAPEYDRGIKYDDPAIGIVWPNLAGEFILSPKDRLQPELKLAEF